MRTWGNGSLDASALPELLGWAVKTAEAREVTFKTDKTAK